MIGILKGLTRSLEDESTFDDDEVESLFIHVKTGMQPLADVKQKGV